MISLEQEKDNKKFIIVRMLKLKAVVYRLLLILVLFCILPCV